MRSDLSNLAAAAAAVAYLAAVVDAGSPFRGRDANGRWRVPRETQAAALAPGQPDYLAQIQPQEAAPFLYEPPAPTAAATLDQRFWERDTTDNTCAYISGNANEALYCPASSDCVANTDSIVGCCADTASTCKIHTTCIPRSRSSAFTTDNSMTLFCSDETYSECVTHLYVDTVYSGYTLYGCGRVSMTDEVYYQATDTSSSSASASASASSESSSAASSSAASSLSLDVSTSEETTTKKKTATVTENATTKTPATATATHTRTPIRIYRKGKAKAGPIAGGVVGGVAGVALAIYGALFVKKRVDKKKKKAAAVDSGDDDAGDAGDSAGARGAPDAPDSPDAPKGQPPMAQNGPYSSIPNSDTGLVAGAGVAGVAADAAAYQYDQQQQEVKYYDAPVHQVHQDQQQQPYDPVHTSMYTTTTTTTMTSPMGSSQPSQSPQSAAMFGTPQPYGATPASAAAVSAQQHTSTSQTPIAPYMAPAPAAGMSFHSGPVPATLSELPAQRGHGNMNEFA